MSALAPYADLATTNVTAPQLTVGDPAKVTIAWTVTNVGTGPGTVSSWVDAIIVSPDNDPTHGTIINQFTHTGILAINGSYQQSQTFLLPAGYTTHSHLFVRTDATGQVFENGNEANNYGEAPNIFDVTPIPYADLAVSNVSSAVTAGSGQSMQVSWTVTNQSPNAIGDDQHPRMERLGLLDQRSGRQQYRCQPGQLRPHRRACRRRQLLADGHHRHLARRPPWHFLHRRPHQRAL